MIKKIKYSLILISIVLAISISILQITANQIQMDIDDFYSNYTTLKDCESKYYEISQYIEFYDFLLENTNNTTKRIRLLNNSEVLYEIRFEDICSGFNEPIKEKYESTENREHRIKQLENLTNECFHELGEEIRTQKGRESEYISKKDYQKIFSSCSLVLLLVLIIIQALNICFEYNDNEKLNGEVSLIKRKLNEIFEKGNK